MTMQRRHFELIAETLAASKPAILRDRKAYNAWLEVLNAFADMLASTNRNFDRARFLRACGVES